MGCEGFNERDERGQIFTLTSSSGQINRAFNKRGKHYAPAAAIRREVGILGLGLPKSLSSFGKLQQTASLVKEHQRQGHSINFVQTRTVLAILNWDGERNGFSLDLRSH